MLELEDVRFGHATFEMRADMILRQGQKYAVIGPSGAGKSTLLAALCGFLPVRGGKVLWQGNEITDMHPAERPMTMLFQDNNLFPHLSVMQNVGLGITPAMRLSRDDARRVEDALARVGLADHRDKKPGALSGGQQSRAALARVLVQARPIVLLDEPFAALGPALRYEMLDLVADLVTETGAALIMVTHAPEDVRRIADQVIFVADGRAEAPQPAGALMDNPPPALKAYLG